MPHSRRRALKLGLASLLASIASKSAARDLSGKKVIIVGAGIAGLSAAKTLQNRGAEVQVLEAGNYVGGRIRTDRSLGAPFELGAGWIHGPSPRNPVQKLASQAGARTFVTDDDSLEIYDQNGQPLSDADYLRLDRLYNKVRRHLDRGPDRWGAKSIFAALQEVLPNAVNDPLTLWMLSAYIEFDLGAGLNQISAANANADKAFPGKDVILPGGYDQILAPLAQDLDIRLNTRVSRISYGETGVEVTANTTRYTGDYVVCTLPLGVLKTNRITFTPALPAPMREVIANIGFGSVTKIALKFRTPFWDIETQYFGIVTQPLGRWNYWINYRTFSNENILLGLSFGQYAPIADRMSKAAMTRDALKVLRSVWADAVPEPKAVLTTHWSQDPNFNGAYSYPQTGGSIRQFESFAQPVNDRLFMAGEHTIFDYHSTTHGAFLSGLRAANAILDL